MCRTRLWKSPGSEKGLPMRARFSEITSRLVIILVATVILLAALAVCAHAQEGMNIPKIDIGVANSKEPEEVATSIQILFLLTILSLAPALLIMLTSFTRIVIVLSFTRSAVGAPMVPPNAVLMGLALFLTFFTMAPTFSKINDSAYKPYMNEEITFQEAVDEATVPLKEFMMKQTRDKDIALFITLQQGERPTSRAELSMTTLIPAFLISELRTAFTIGFVIYIPFLVIDTVISVILMSMGMMMLPPIMISLPFKILLFVLVDGWYLLARSLAVSFA